MSDLGRSRVNDGSQNNRREGDTLRTEASRAQLRRTRGGIFRENTLLRPRNPITNPVARGEIWDISGGHDSPLNRYEQDQRLGRPRRFHVSENPSSSTGSLSTINDRSSMRTSTDSLASQMHNDSVDSLASYDSRLVYMNTIDAQIDARLGSSRGDSSPDLLRSQASQMHNDSVDSLAPSDRSGTRYMRRHNNSFVSSTASFDGRLARLNELDAELNAHAQFDLPQPTDSSSSNSDLLRSQASYISDRSDRTNSTSSFDPYQRPEARLRFHRDGYLDPSASTDSFNSSRSSSPIMMRRPTRRRPE
jgi:hypothetical protein